MLLTAADMLSFLSMCFEKKRLITTTTCSNYAKITPKTLPQSSVVNGKKIKLYRPKYTLLFLTLKNLWYFSFFFSAIIITNGARVLFAEKGSEEFNQFITLLGKRVRLKGWDKYRGGLDVKGDFFRNGCVLMHRVRDFYLFFLNLIFNFNMVPVRLQVT